MFKDTPAFSGFSVDNLASAKLFYGETLGVTVEEDEMGLTLKLTGGTTIFVYPKENHIPAAYTILNFSVPDIDKAVDELTGKGVTFEKYDDPHMPQDEKGILRGLSVKMGPDIAWFKDSAGNILAVLQEK